MKPLFIIGEAYGVKTEGGTLAIVSQTVNVRCLPENLPEFIEVDVTDRGNVRVTQPYDGHMVTLILGDERFAARYQNFLNHYAEIHEKLPGAGILDLRLEDRITVVDEKGGA